MIDEPCTWTIGDGVKVALLPTDDLLEITPKHRSQPEIRFQLGLEKPEQAVRLSYSKVSRGLCIYKADPVLAAATIPCKKAEAIAIAEQIGIELGDADRWTITDREAI